MVKINKDVCMLCGGCASVCPFNCITVTEREVIIENCKECGICEKFCPVGAIE